ncbi:MAG: DMT family transporter [Synergistaceae bacterium]
MKTNKNELLGIFLIIMAGITWGANGTIPSALAPKEASTIAIGASRIVFTGLLMAIMLLLKDGLSAFKLTSKNKGIFLAATGLIFYQFSFYTAIKLTGVTISTMITIGSSTIFAGIIGLIFFKEKLTKKWSISTLMALTGCLLLSISNNGNTSYTFSAHGIILSFLTGVSYSIIGAGLRLEGDGSFKSLAMSFLLSGCVGLPILLLTGASWILTPSGISTVLIISLFTTIIPYLFFFKGINRIPLGKAYTLSLTEPLTAWILSSLILGERLSIIGIIGVILLSFAIILLACEKK